VYFLLINSAATTWSKPTGSTFSKLEGTTIRKPPPSNLRSPYRALSTTAPRHQDVFHSQTQDSSSSTILSSLKTSNPRTPQTLTEKIVQKYSLGLPPSKVVLSGDYVTISPHHCMTHDNSYPVARKFMSIGASKIYDPNKS